MHKIRSWLVFSSNYDIIHDLIENHWVIARWMIFWLNSIMGLRCRNKSLINCTRSCYTVKVAPRSEYFAISYNNGCIRNLHDGHGELSGLKLANQLDILSTRKYYYYIHLCFKGLLG